MFWWIYELLWNCIYFYGDLIEEKLLCWLLELLSMFGVNKNYILEKCGSSTCEFIAFHMHHGCVKEKKFKKHDDEN